MKTATIETETVSDNGSQALAMMEHNRTEPHLTPAQAKVDAIAALTMSAYAKASSLQLTAEEQAKLAEEFPDEAFKPGAAGKEHLIYIEHAYLRDRFNATFRPGQWAIIPRNRWAEPFTTAKGVDGSRVYVEAMLMIRGCFVAEAVGAMEYYPSNAGQDYSDAVEGAKTAAFRRCAKELGVGLQAWKKDFCEGWWKRRNGFTPKNNPSAGGRGPRDPAFHPSAAARTVRTSPQAKPVQGVGEKAAEKPVKSAAPKCATEATRKWFMTTMASVCGEQWEDHGTEFVRNIGWLLPDVEGIADLPLRFVPATKAQLTLFAAALNDFVNGDAPVVPYPPNPESDGPPDKKTTPRANQEPSSPLVEEVPRDEHMDPNSPDAPWRTFKLHIGKDKGTELGKLDKKVLFGWAKNFVVTEEYNGRAKRPETIAMDKAFKAALVEAAKHYEWNLEAE